jgi:hypothetical protein
MVVSKNLVAGKSNPDLMGSGRNQHASVHALKLADMPTKGSSRKPAAREGMTAILTSAVTFGERFPPP